MTGDAIGVTITRDDGVWFVPWAQVSTARLADDLSAPADAPPQGNTVASARRKR